MINLDTTDPTPLEEAGAIMFAAIAALTEALAIVYGPGSILKGLIDRGDSSAV